jgi:two-component system cell cycle sensor histidine kinase/response regulator CckA
MTTAPIRILLVEDDDPYASLIDAELRTASLAAVLRRSRTLTEAMRILGQDEFDVVLLDLGLPDSSGLDTLRRVQQVAIGIPIVVLTAEESDALAISAVQSGAEDYLLKSSTDVHLLSRALRYACERAASRQALRQSEEQLRHAQKMEAVGRLAGGVAHDFNNVLTAIFGYVDLLLEQFSDDDPRRADLLEIRRSAERAASLTRQLLAFSRKQVLQPRLLDLNEVILNLEKLLLRLMMSEIELVLNLAPGLWKVRADPGQIEQVIVNLCANARDAMQEGGRLELSTGNEHVPGSAGEDRRGLPAGNYVVLTVSDNGHGIPEHIREHIFEPFFTTKGQGKGTGLGLSTVYGIVQQSGGAIAVRSELGAGTEFDIFLPRASAGQPARIPAETPAARPHGGETILLVEDDEAVRESATEFLSDRGYTIVQAKNGAEALDLVNRFPGPIHMVVSDVIMPVMSGPELARRLATVRPTLRVLFISGYTENMFAQYGLTQEALLQKPFTLSALGERIRQTLDAAWAGPVGAPVSV